MTRANAYKAPSVMAIYSFPDGSIQVTTTRRRGNTASGEQSWWQNLDEDDKHADKRRRVANRARQQLMRLIRTGNLRRLLTFTNGGEGDGWRSAKEALSDVMRWYREEGHELLGNTAFVVIAEQGGDFGRWHVHAAIRSGYYIPYSKIINSYSTFMESRGFHSSVGTHRFHAGDEQGKHKDGFTSARWCARYMAKYLAKSFEDTREAHERRYRADGLLVPEPQKMHPGTLQEAADMAADTWQGGSIVWFDDGEGNPAGFWMEWEPSDGG